MLNRWMGGFPLERTVLGFGVWGLAPNPSGGQRVSAWAEPGLEAGWAGAPQLPLAGAARTYRPWGINRIKF